MAKSSSNIPIESENDARALAERARGKMVGKGEKRETALATKVYGLSFKKVSCLYWEKHKGQSSP